MQMQTHASVGLTPNSINSIAGYSPYTHSTLLHTAPHPMTSTQPFDPGARISPDSTKLVRGEEGETFSFLPLMDS